METISVRPLEGKGWMVEVSSTESPQVFRSGGKAESAALDLARRLADAGLPSRTVIYTRDGQIAGQFVAAL